jgi:hypothetical protein
MSTSYGFFSTISAGTIYGKHVGDGSGLTGIPNTGAVLAVSNNVTTVSNTVNYLLAVSNFSAVSMSTSYGFFSTISVGTIFGKYVGDGSSLTSIPNTGAVLAVSNNVTTVSNLLNAVSTNATNISTNVATVSNSVNTVSNTVNYLLGVSNISAITMSTSLGTFSSINATYGYISSLVVDSFTIGFSTGYISMTDVVATSLSSMLINTGNLRATTISSAGIYGKFYGDGSALTGVSGGGGAFSIPIFVSTNTLSTNLITASNISTNAISTNQAFITLLSSPAIYGTFYGDGTNLTGVSGGGGGGMASLPPILSTTLLSTGLLTACNISSATISTTQAFISSLTVNTLQIGETTGFITMGDLLTNSISTNNAYISSIKDTGYPINLVGYGGVRITDTQSGYSGILSVNTSGQLLWNGSNVNLSAPV